MNNYQRVFEEFLKVYPLSHALPRGLESMLFCREKLENPILDLGCGDGSFALLTFGKGKIDLGVDLDPKEIAKSKKKKVYKDVLIGDVQDLPLLSNAFGTVVANSFLEHVPNLDLALKEVNRVLKGGGMFIFTVPNLAERKEWFWAKIFGNFYLEISDKLMHHYPFYNQKAWEYKLKKAGFEIVSCQNYASKKTVRLLDFLVPFGIPFQLTGKVFGPRKLIAKIFMPYFYHQPRGGFGYYFKVRKKY